jgi:hypothetical protein
VERGERRSGVRRSTWILVSGFGISSILDEFAVCSALLLMSGASLIMSSDTVLSQRMLSWALTSPPLSPILRPLEWMLRRTTSSNLATDACSCDHELKDDHKSRHLISLQVTEQGRILV